MLSALPPFLRTALVTDGSVTRSPEAGFGETLDATQLDQHKTPTEVARHYRIFLNRRPTILISKT